MPTPPHTLVPPSLLLLAAGNHQAYRAVRAAYTLTWHVQRVQALDAHIPEGGYPANAALVKASGKLLETVEAKTTGWQVCGCATWWSPG